MCRIVQSDNTLKITTAGREAALDLRLLLPHLRDNPDSKTNQAVEKIHQVWLDSVETKGAQLIFCDLFTPQAGGKGFSVYDDVRGKLLTRGVFPDQIALVQDFDAVTSKASLFKAVRGFDEADRPSFRAPREADLRRKAPAGDRQCFRHYRESGIGSSYIITRGEWRSD